MSGAASPQTRDAPRHVRTRWRRDVAAAMGVSELIVWKWESGSLPIAPVYRERLESFGLQHAPARPAKLCVSSMGATGLATVRAARGWTIDDLSSLLGDDPKSLAWWERGARIPQRRRWQHVIDALGFDSADPDVVAEAARVVSEMDRIVAHLRRRRLAAGLSQAQLAAMVGVDATANSHWERHVREPKPGQRRALWRVLGAVSADGDYAGDRAVLIGYLTMTADTERAALERVPVIAQRTYPLIGTGAEIVGTSRDAVWHAYAGAAVDGHVHPAGVSRWRIPVVAMAYEPGPEPAFAALSDRAAAIGASFSARDVARPLLAR